MFKHSLIGKDMVYGLSGMKHPWKRHYGPLDLLFDWKKYGFMKR